jgi:hypothetical protein
MCVVDRRSRKRRETDDENLDDEGQWLGKHSGNRIDVLVESPGGEKLGPFMLDRIFGLAR